MLRTLLKKGIGGEKRHKDNENEVTLMKILICEQLVFGKGWYQCTKQNKLLVDNKLSNF
jgi:hypothetical protein